MINVGYTNETQFTTSNIAKIFRTLTKNLYPEPLKSTVIEIVSNAKDSMIKAGKEKGQYTFSGEEISISKKDYKKIIKERRILLNK
jgi:hypothetical protein